MPRPQRRSSRGLLPLPAPGTSSTAVCMLCQGRRKPRPCIPDQGGFGVCLKCGPQAEFPSMPLREPLLGQNASLLPWDQAHASLRVSRHLHPTSKASPTPPSGGSSQVPGADSPAGLAGLPATACPQPPTPGRERC